MGFCITPPKPKSNKMTRYFVFTRIRPTRKDYNLLRKLSTVIDAFIGYSTEFGRVPRLVGFFILRGPKTRVSIIHRFFPNFLVSQAPDEFDFDLVCDILLNEHPYIELKRNLFGV